MYSIQTIAEVLHIQLSSTSVIEVEDLVYDTRKIRHPQSSLFFAIQTAHGDGHNFIRQAYQKGVRAFVVSKPVEFEGAAILLVKDTLAALQSLTAWHRSKFKLPVIGITGSNGKTVVKEWLHTLLEPDYHIIRSPKSFNSQIGVPLSVWEVRDQHTLGIFEAGISQPGEMEKLQRIIRPTIGIITNIGEAHSEGFSSRQEKLQEKLKLFTEAEVVIGPEELVAATSSEKFTWSYTNEASLKINSARKDKASTLISGFFKDKVLELSIPFSDDASVENAITCWCVLLYFNIDQATIQKRFLSLHAIDMRLQLGHAINHCIVINDSYSADPTSLKIALDFLQQQSSGLKRTVIISDFFESGKSDDILYSEIAQLINTYRIEKLIAIGERFSAAFKSRLNDNIQFQSYQTTEEFIRQFKSSGFFKEIILLKGARKFYFERIAGLFEQKLHGTVLQINLAALRHNLKEYQRVLKPSTKIMAMVKAFSYGSGGAEIAAVLQFNHVAYLGVAYADEGINLVQAGITVPIMVMNAEPTSFAAIVENNLQPVIYSWQLLNSFETYVSDQGIAAYPVHLELETGMNRLGFSTHEVELLSAHFAAHSFLKIQSVFSHLAGSENPKEDDFTSLQAHRFEEAVSQLKKEIAYPFLKHISNSAAIIRHPHLQMDMVRLGIGLYGIDPGAEEKLALQPVATLRSTVAQIKKLKAGESVGYNRRGIVHRNSVIATVRIGYADGYSRQAGSGKGKMLVKGQLASVIGTVCMDMTMIDVTDIPDVKEGDDVVVFGLGLPVQDMASWINTIPYEVMTSVSQRVKRVYYHE